MNAKKLLLKEKNPADINNLKKKIDRLNIAEKNLIPRLDNLKLDVNFAKDKLKSQRELGITSRFSIF
jgi:hypothetical protein